MSRMPANRQVLSTGWPRYAYGPPTGSVEPCGAQIFRRVFGDRIVDEALVEFRRPENTPLNLQDKLNFLAQGFREKRPSDAIEQAASLIRLDLYAQTHDFHQVQLSDSFLPHPSGLAKASSPGYHVLKLWSWRTFAEAEALGKVKRNNPVVIDLAHDSARRTLDRWSHTVFDFHEATDLLWSDPEYFGMYATRASPGAKLRLVNVMSPAVNSILFVLNKDYLRRKGESDNPSLLLLDPNVQYLNLLHEGLGCTSFYSDDRSAMDLTQPWTSLSRRSEERAGFLAKGGDFLIPRQRQPLLELALAQCPRVEADGSLVWFRYGASPTGAYSIVQDSQDQDTLQMALDSAIIYSLQTGDPFPWRTIRTLADDCHCWGDINNDDALFHSTLLSHKRYGYIQKRDSINLQSCDTGSTYPILGYEVSSKGAMLPLKKAIAGCLTPERQLSAADILRTQRLRVLGYKNLMRLSTPFQHACKLYLDFLPRSPGFRSEYDFEEFRLFGQQQYLVSEELPNRDLLAAQTPFRSGGKLSRIVDRHKHIFESLATSPYDLARLLKPPSSSGRRVRDRS